MKFIKRNINIKNIFLVFVLLLVLVFPIVSYAQTTPPNPQKTGGMIVNPLGTNGPQSIPAFIHDVLVGVVKIGIPIVALAIIYSGFLFVAARGKPEAITHAKDALLYTLIGAGLLLGAWALAKLIVDVVGNIS
jgi:hypothetical protein